MPTIAIAAFSFVPVGRWAEFLLPAWSDQNLRRYIFMHTLCKSYMNYYFIKHAFTIHSSIIYWTTYTTYKYIFIFNIGLSGIVLTTFLHYIQAEPLHFEGPGGGDMGVPHAQKETMVENTFATFLKIPKQQF